MGKFKDEDAIRKFVIEKNQGEPRHVFGPSGMDLATFNPAKQNNNSTSSPQDSVQVWEVWVLSEDEWFTRYIVDSGESELDYFDGFQVFCVYLNSFLRVRPVSMQVKVAATVFLASAGVVLGQFYTGRPVDWVSSSMVFAILASGAVMFFGNFTQPTLPGINS